MASPGWSGATCRCARRRPATRIGQMETCAGGQCQGALGGVDRRRPASMSGATHITLRWGAERVPSSSCKSAQTVPTGRKTQTRRAPHDRSRESDLTCPAGCPARGEGRGCQGAPPASTWCQSSTAVGGACRKKWRRRCGSGLTWGADARSAAHAAACPCAGGESNRIGGPFREDVGNRTVWCPLTLPGERAVLCPGSHAGARVRALCQVDPPKRSSFRKAA